MDCLYCGKEISSIRQLQGKEFCSSAHQRLHAERLRKAILQLGEPEPAPSPAAGPIWDLPPFGTTASHTLNHHVRSASSDLLHQPSASILHIEGGMEDPCPAVLPLAATACNLASGLAWWPHFLRHETAWWTGLAPRCDDIRGLDTPELCILDGTAATGASQPRLAVHFAVEGTTIPPSPGAMTVEAGGLALDLAPPAAPIPKAASSPRPPVPWSLDPLRPRTTPTLHIPEPHQDSAYPQFNLSGPACHFPTAFARLPRPWSLAPQCQAPACAPKLSELHLNLLAQRSAAEITPASSPPARYTFTPLAASPAPGSLSPRCEVPASPLWLPELHLQLAVEPGAIEAVPASSPPARYSFTPLALSPAPWSLSPRCEVPASPTRLPQLHLQLVVESGATEVTPASSPAARYTFLPVAVSPTPWSPDPRCQSPACTPWLPDLRLNLTRPGIDEPATQLSTALSCSFTPVTLTGTPGSADNAPAALPTPRLPELRLGVADDRSATLPPLAGWAAARLAPVTALTVPTVAVTIAPTPHAGLGAISTLIPAQATASAVRSATTAARLPEPDLDLAQPPIQETADLLPEAAAFSSPAADPLQPAPLLPRATSLPNQVRAVPEPKIAGTSSGQSFPTASHTPTTAARGIGGSHDLDQVIPRTAGPLYLLPVFAGSPRIAGPAANDPRPLLRPAFLTATASALLSPTAAGQSLPLGPALQAAEAAAPTSYGPILAEQPLISTSPAATTSPVLPPATGFPLWPFPATPPIRIPATTPAIVVPACLRIVNFAPPAAGLAPAITSSLQVVFYVQHGRPAPIRREEWNLPRPTVLRPALSLTVVETASDASTRRPNSADLARPTQRPWHRSEAAFWGRGLAAGIAILAFLFAGSAGLRTRGGSGEPAAVEGTHDEIALSVPPAASRTGGFAHRVRQAIASRAKLEVGSDFRSSKQFWDGAHADWGKGWQRHPAGYVVPGQLALFRPSVQLTNYRLEFMTQIENRGMSWAVRARDTGNYYAMKFNVVEPGLRPVISIARYTVTNGKRGRRSEIPLQVMVHNHTPYRVTVDVLGNRITTFIEGEQVDTWADDTLAKGGVGFFSEGGDRARLFWMKVTNNDDMLGRICAYLANTRSGESRADSARFYVPQSAGLTLIPAQAVSLEPTL